MGPIELIRASGTHREAGRVIGAATADYLRASTGEAFDRGIPGGRSRAEQLDLAAAYREATAAAFPQVVAECEGIAEGAGVDALALFARGVEEIWYEPYGRCSDLVAGPGATTDGHLIVGHNNDLSPSTERWVVAIERRIEGEPVVFTLGVGPWPSAGWSSAGISFTGNELSPNDERIGVPRLLQFRAMLGQSGLVEVEGAALHPDRASSYNNLLATRDGLVVNIEGSATDAELTGLDSRGLLAHTNHYACDRMLPFEGDHGYAVGSAVRLARGRDLLELHAGHIDAPKMREMLADHDSSPPLCRHTPLEAAPKDTSKTVFWCVVDVTEMAVRYGRGNPCEPGEQEYRFT